MAPSNYPISSFSRSCINVYGFIVNRGGMLRQLLVVYFVFLINHSSLEFIDYIVAKPFLKLPHINEYFMFAPLVSASYAEFHRAA